MGRACTICNHREKDAIDRELVRRDVLTQDLAPRFSVSADALWRHRRNHLAKVLALAPDAAEVLRGADLLEQLQDVQVRTVKLLERAERSGKPGVMLGAIRESRMNLELLAKLQGQLDERPQVNLLIAPIHLQMRAALMQALEPYPEARVAVAARLDALDALP